MIKDIVVNLSVGERTSPAGDYAPESGNVRIGVIYYINNA